MKHITFTPENVCSMQIDFDIDEAGTLHHVDFTGGCNGNLQAIAKLVEGRPAAEIADLLRGNDCAMKGTSCADQFAKAIDQALA